MSEHEKETAFFREVMRYYPGGEGEDLAERIQRVQREERCVARAIWLMGFFIALAVVGMGYTAILLNRIPEEQFDWIINVFSVVVTGSVIAMAIYFLLWLKRRMELLQCREECRQMVLSFLQHHSPSR